MITGSGFFVGASIGWDVAAGSVSTSIASVGALEDASGTAGATMAGEFCGMGGKFMGVVELFTNPKAVTNIS